MAVRGRSPFRFRTEAVRFARSLLPGILPAEGAESLAAEFLLTLAAAALLLGLLTA